MKKYLELFLILTIAAALSACGNANGASGNTESSDYVATQEASDTESVGEETTDDSDEAVYVPSEDEVRGMRETYYMACRTMILPLCAVL